jgi:hypothetical protein
MIQHDSYEYSSPMKPDSLPFNFMRVSGDSIWIDNMASKIQILDDGISFEIEGKSHLFEVSQGNNNQRTIFLSSKTFTPKGKIGSYYYFTRIE